MLRLNGKIYYVSDEETSSESKMYDIGRSPIKIKEKCPLLYEYLGENIVSVIPKEIHLTGDHPKVLATITFEDQTGVTKTTRAIPLRKFSGCILVNLNGRDLFLISRYGLVIPSIRVRQKFGKGSEDDMLKNIDIFMNLGYDDGESVAQMLTMLKVLK